MPRRKKSKSHLTLKKKSHTQVDKATPEGLSERQFTALLHDYSSFELEDSEHDKLVYSIHDVYGTLFISVAETSNVLRIYMEHEHSRHSGVVAEDNHWIGKICEIRGDSPDNVWIKVQWYWSPQEVAEVIKSFDPTICGKYEKLLSDSHDFVSVGCIVGHAEVKHFDECSIYQDFIGDEEWFSRYEFLYNARRITPKVTSPACPICKLPYIPGVETKILHFCPRPRCCKFYHQSCLVKNGYVQKRHNYRVLETWPDIDRTETVEDLADSYHPKKRQKKDHLGTKESVCDPLAAFPAKLVAVAEQQIVRGIQTGVVGNINSVATARQLIFRALMEGGDIPNDWEARVDASMTFTGLPCCVCPSCHSPI